jgi:hypothetical protein
LWDWRFGELISFSGTAVYALEGIALVLPCERSLNDKSYAFPVCSTSLLLYATIVCGYSALVFSSGVSTEECDIITDCFRGTPAMVIRVALSGALILSHPVTLYPATELVELLMERRGWIGGGGGGDGSDDDDDDDDDDNYEHIQQSNLLKPGSALTGSNLTGSITSSSNSSSIDVSMKSKYKLYWNKNTILPFLVRSTLATTTLIAGALIESFSLFSNFVGAVGLTAIGFVLPVILYIEACKRVGTPLTIKGLGRYNVMAMTGCIVFGLYNIVITGGSAAVQLFAGDSRR